jgi:hypothetical protein
VAEDGVAEDAAENKRFGRSAVADTAAAVEMKLRRDNGRFMSVCLDLGIVPFCSLVPISLADRPLQKW